MIIVVLILSLGIIYFLYKIEKTLAKNLENISSAGILSKTEIQGVAFHVDALRQEIAGIALRGNKSGHEQER